MRKAFIDIGTNTFNLLVFEGEPSGEAVILKVIHDEEVPVSLGKGGLEKGSIADDAFARGLAALEKFVATARSLNADPIKGLGCSTLRNAANAK
nr:hypothetical protein [Bacteroidota bacterium]